MPSIRLTSRRTFLLSSLFGLTASTSGCGTLLYPERRGQPAGRLDWEIVILNGIGLLLFFVPGIIAFAVDFSNGTIYLPPDEYGSAPTGSGTGTALREVSLGTSRPSVQDVEDALRREADVQVSLRQRPFVSQSLSSLDQFWSTEQTLRRQQQAFSPAPDSGNVQQPS